MAQEEIHRFPQGGFPEPCHGLGMFLYRPMQGITGDQHLLRRDEAFQFRRGQIVNQIRILGHAAKHLICRPFRLGFVREVPLDAPPSHIVSQLAKRLPAIARLVKSDCVFSVRD